ncbi:MAG: AAA family ATPase [Candidatus Bathyarchaeota archaeon]|nr:MAG: AAA family ATPase [Candidatus Bathyarchaeota archaeon]
MQITIPTGCRALDEKLRGGVKGRKLVLLYGEAETGKTTLVIQLAINCAQAGYKTIFVDADNTFFSRRLRQLAGDNFETIAPQMILMKPESFEQQNIAINNLDDYVSSRVKLVVIDTITSLYRAELGKGRDAFKLNRELNRQLGYLAQIVNTKKVACIVVSQVRSVLPKEEGVIVPVAVRVLRFWADTVISMRPTSKGDVVKLTVSEKGLERPVKAILLKIEEKGLQEI